MPQQTTHFKLGLFVVTGVAVLATALFWVGFTDFDKQTVDVTAFFDEPVTGLDVGSPIRFRGMTIGSVTEVRVALDRVHLQVIARVDIGKAKGIGLARADFEPGEPTEFDPGMRTFIERSFVTGVAFIQADIFTDPPPVPTYPFPMPKGIYVLPTIPSTQKTLEQAMRDLLRQLPEMTEETKQILQSLNEKIEAIEIEKLVERLDRIGTSIEEMVDEMQRQKLGEQLSQTLAEVRAAVDTLQTYVVDPESPPNELITRLIAAIDSAERSIEAADLGATTDSARESMVEFSKLGRDLRTMIPQLQRSLVALTRFAELLEREPDSMIFGRSPPTRPREQR